MRSPLRPALVTLALAALVLPGCPLSHEVLFDDGGGIFVDPCGATVVGTRLGTLATGSTRGQSDDRSARCAAPGGPDRLFLWQAPRSGRYRFDTLDSDFDTVLYARTSCDDPESDLECNDDSAGSLQSTIELSLSAGERIYLIVDGYGGDAGSFRLRVREL